MVLSSKMGTEAIGQSVQENPAGGSDLGYVEIPGKAAPEAIVFP
jgi:hypothetical protein